MKKFLKNKYVIFIIIVFLIITCFVVNKIAKRYNYVDSNEIVSEEEINHSNDEKDLLLDKEAEKAGKQEEEENVDDSESVEVGEENENASDLKNKINKYRK